MELGTFSARHPSNFGDSIFTILRIDPQLWDLNFVGATHNSDAKLQTAREWSKSHHLSAVINAGMFGEDNKTHIGYLRSKDYLNNKNINKYESVAAFDPENEALPRFRIFDLDDAGVNMGMILQNYHSAIQNLRLIKRPGQNRWSQQRKMWSEAALGEDKLGRILFIFCRSPFTMHDFNEELLQMDIGLVSAQHLEGGPEAQLYIHVGKLKLELFGSYETSFREDDANSHPWPVPNVLGVRRRHR